MRANKARESALSSFTSERRRESTSRRIFSSSLSDFCAHKRRVLKCNHVTCQHTRGKAATHLQAAR